MFHRCRTVFYQGAHDGLAGLVGGWFFGSGEVEYIGALGPSIAGAGESAYIMKRRPGVAASGVGKFVVLVRRL